MIICTIICGLIALLCFAISILQFKEKGFLFNNAYIYASKDEREKLNKKPYYIQAGICFLMIGIIFLVIATEFLLQISWLFYIVIGIIIVVILYAIVSTVIIEKK